MKIGLFFPAVEYGGQEKNLVALANAMYKKNVPVDVITYDDKKLITQILNPKINRVFLNKSNNYKFSILIISIFLSAILLPISYAQAPAVLTNFTVLDPNGNDVTDEFLVAGGSYTINFEIEIGATLSDNILLTTSMEKSGNSFWTLNNNYQGVDTSVWTPGSQSITFQAVEGTAQFTLDGKIPESITEKEEIDKLLNKESLKFTEFKNYLSNSEYFKEVIFIDKQTATENHKKDLGEDFEITLGFSPLLNSIDTKVKAEYVSPIGLIEIEKYIDDKL
mgnify:CR=1 FL=1